MVHCRGTERLQQVRVQNNLHAWSEFFWPFVLNGFRGSLIVSFVTNCQVAVHYFRHEFERSLEFYGLVVLQNSLKTETIPALRELHSADIRTVMVTGEETDSRTRPNSGLQQGKFSVSIQNLSFRRQSADSHQNCAFLQHDRA